jgi:hypothetical protein
MQWTGSRTFELEKDDALKEAKNVQKDGMAGLGAYRSWPAVSCKGDTRGASVNDLWHQTQQTGSMTGTGKPNTICVSEAFQPVGNATWTAGITARV